MSRSGYSDYDNWSLIKWRGMVASATRGKRGQKFFVDLLAALDAMPEKKLIADSLVEPNYVDCGPWGLVRSVDDVCALGALAVARDIDVDNLDPEDSSTVANTFDIAECLAREVVYENDEGGSYSETPERRWARMRAWAKRQIKGEAV